MCSHESTRPMVLHPALARWSVVLPLSVVLVQVSLLGADANLPLTEAAAISAKPIRGTDPLERIVILGASASAGFTVSEPLGGPTTARYRLSRYVEAAITTPHRPVRNLASTFFFMQPEAEGKRQIDSALEHRPTLALAADFLFWFCYGEGRTDQDRLQRFETGLKLCERLQCPVVLGDIPNASSAVNGMLSADQMPSQTAISAANRRLRLWAAARPNVAVLSLSNFMAGVAANRALLVHGHSLPKDTTGVLLQPDRLHPSPPGCAVLALLMLDAYQTTHPGLPTNEVRWDPREVFRIASVHTNGESSPTPKPGKPAPKTE